MQNLLQDAGIYFEDDWDKMPRLTKPSRLNLTTTNIPKDAFITKPEEIPKTMKAKGKARPSTMSDTTRTKSTLSRTNASLNSLNSKKPGKLQEGPMDTSIILDFIAETEKQDNGLQKKIFIRPAKKLHKQFFYNSIYDVRQAQSPLEMRISQLDKIHQEKTEDMLWNRPPQTIIQGMLENFARTQPNGAISQLLSLEKEKDQMRRSKKIAQRPSSLNSRSLPGIRPRTVEGFFKQDPMDEYNLLSIVGSKKASHQVPKEFTSKDVAKNVEYYASSLDNINTLLHSTQGEEQIIENLDMFLQDTPDSKKIPPGETFEKWSETSLKIAEELGGRESANEYKPNKIPNELSLINDYASMDFIVEDQTTHTKPSGRVSVSASNARTVKFNLEANIEQETKPITKSPRPSLLHSDQVRAVAIIRKRPNTTAAAIREALIKKAKSSGALCLEGKKALPEMFAANLSENNKPIRQTLTLNDVEITAPSDMNKRSYSPFSPGRWVLEGTLLSNSKNKQETEEERKTVKEAKIVENYHRKGHIPAMRMSNGPSKNQSKLLNMMKKPTGAGGMRMTAGVVQKGPLHRLKTQFSKGVNDSPNLNGWATYNDSAVPSFRMSRADTNQSVQSNQDSAC